METIELTWTQFKDLISKKYLKFAYKQTKKWEEVDGEDIKERYNFDCFAEEGQIMWRCNLIDETEVDDFLANYEDTCCVPLQERNSEGRQIILSTSRPKDATTCFIGQGDGTTTIGDGKILAWDFSNSDDEVTAPTNFKRKRLEFGFIDPMWVKEGTLYFFDAPKGSYMDFYVVCPDGEYYKKNDGTLAQASGDLIIMHYVVHNMIQGTCPMGDELNTESCSDEIPANYKFWIEITTPDTDTTSNGHVNLEIYRTRTVVLE